MSNKLFAGAARTALFCAMVIIGSIETWSEWTTISNHPNVRVRWQTNAASIWEAGPAIEFQSDQDVKVRYSATVEYADGSPSKWVSNTLSGTISVSKRVGGVVKTGAGRQGLMVKSVTAFLVD